MRAAAAAVVAVAISCIALLAGGRLHGQVAMADRREVEVPKKMLAAIGRELASDASNMAALKGKVSRLDRTVSKLRLQRASRASPAAMQEPIDLTTDSDATDVDEDDASLQLALRLQREEDANARKRARDEDASFALELQRQDEATAAAIRSAGPFEVPFEVPFEGP